MTHVGWVVSCETKVRNLDFRIAVGVADIAPHKRHHRRLKSWRRSRPREERGVRGKFCVPCLARSVRTRDQAALKRVHACASASAPHGLISFHMPSPQLEQALVDWHAHPAFAGFCCPQALQPRHSLVHKGAVRDEGAGVVQQSVAKGGAALWKVEPAEALELPRLGATVAHQRALEMKRARVSRQAAQGAPTTKGGNEGVG